MKKKFDSDLRQFPTTRYQGSKRKLIPWIYENCKDLKFETVLDGFGGSASVSYLFKQMNREVHYNDKLKFNYLIGRCLIENKSVKLLDAEAEQILTSSITTNNTVSENFNGVYYLPEENELIDRIVSNILDIQCCDKETEEIKKSLGYYALFQTCLIKRPYNLFHRNNLNIRTAEVKRNFGNKTTWEQPIQQLFSRFIAEANNSVFDNNKKCLAINKSVFDVDPYGYDLVYLDPPYIRDSGSNESSDYLRCYHFLEGLSNYESWKDNIDFESVNFRLKNVSNGNDFTKANIINRIEDLFYKFRDSIIVMSYKIGGIPSVEQLEHSMKKVKKNVYTASLHYKYALNKQNGNAALNREVLIIGI